MILALFASLLLAQPAEVPPPAENGAEAGEVQNGQNHDASVEDAVEAADEAAEAVEEAAEEVTEAAEEAAEAATEVAEEAAEAVEEQVCRRRTVTDDFGRIRSRKVCRPR
jgi:methyl-accepting chemotaxis protein